MLAYAIDNPAPSTIILITGDRDFAYAMSILRLRQYRVVLVTLPNAHLSLTAQASKRIDWYSEVLNQVEQPVARTPNTNIPSFGRAASSQDKTPSPSSSYQSTQLVQETRESDRADQGDLVQYIRSATDYRRRSSTPDNAPLITSAVYPPSVYQSQYPEHPRQDTSSLVEVELRYQRPGPSPPMPLNMVKDLDPPVSPQRKCSPNRAPVTAARDDEGRNDSCAAPTATETLSFSSSLKNPGPPSPLPNSLPSSSSASIAVVASITEPPPFRVPSLVGNPPQDGISPIHPISTVQLASDSPPPQPISVSSPSTTPVISREAIVSPVTVPPTSLDASFPPNSTSPTIPLIAAPPLLLPNVVHPTVAPAPSTPLVIPSIFCILVQALQEQKSKGNIRPLRSNIAMSISKNGATYKSAGVIKFGDYVSLAQKAGIIELGGLEGAAWISLTATWSSVKLQ